MTAAANIGILKTLWTRTPDGRFETRDIKGITLKPKVGFESDYFAIDSELQLLTNRGPLDVANFFSSFGPTDFLVKQSILPVVAWSDCDPLIRTIGTAFVVGCAGFVVTACHVFLDPQERGYGTVVARDGHIVKIDGLKMGVILPLNPAAGNRGFMFVPFERAWYWGAWQQSPLLHEKARFASLTDVAICKLPERPDGVPYQPLNLSLNPFVRGETAYAIGYAEMDDVPIAYVEGTMTLPEFSPELFVSVGDVMNVFPENHVQPENSTPGPSFDFRARIPGKMSGAPIFGAQGAVIRGVVSRSFQDEKHAFGCMMGPVMALPRHGEPSLTELMRAGGAGIPIINGQGL